MKCKECKKRGKDWQGADPQCAFPDGRLYSQDNWNCATINKLRDMAEDFWSHRDDMRCASIGIVPIPEAEEEGIQQGYIVMTWYKDRGATGQIRVMWDDHEVQKLLLKTAEFVLKHNVEEG